MWGICPASDLIGCNGQKDCRTLKNGKGKGCLKCAAEHRQLAEWLRELQQLREQTQWIPVSKRLPNRDEYLKNNGLFIVSDGNRSYSEWYDIYDKQGFGEPTMSGFRVDRAVTHWMPLPKPYKTESRGYKNDEIRRK